MKVLSILPTFKDETAHNYRINIGFINKLSTLCDYYGIKAYNKDSLVRTAKELYEKYKPDAILLLAHSNMLDGYLKDIPCLKVMIAVDYYKIVERNKFYWYENNQFDIVIQRHIYDIELFNKHIGGPCIWVPYAANKEEFYPTEWKLPKIGFTGTTSDAKYPQRGKALKLLKSEDLINDGGKIVGMKYAPFLRSHRGMLTSTRLGNSGKRTPFAKAFEIIASGSVLLSPPMDYEIIPKDCYVEYKDDCSDVVEKAKWIINNKEEFEVISNNGYEEFKKNHTDTIRIKELYNSIERALEGKELIKKWGI